MGYSQGVAKSQTRLKQLSMLACMPDGVWGPVSALKEGEAEVNPSCCAESPVK